MQLGEPNVFLTVGIGASAGGLNAFKSFFNALPADTGMAFVLIQHLSPDHKSMLAELVGNATKMDVIEARDGQSLKPDCVFVIPPDAPMTIRDGKLTVLKPAPPRERRRPIDTFFLSLAEDLGSRRLRSSCQALAATAPSAQIFGTDLDERAIATARLWRYREPVAGLSPERAERWFTVEGDDCCVIPEIREMCNFSVHSVIKHPPFSRLDLISCRNLPSIWTPQCRSGSCGRSTMA